MDSSGTKNNALNPAGEDSFSDSPGSGQNRPVKLANLLELTLQG